MKIEMRLYLALSLLQASAAFAAAPVIQGVVNGANYQPAFASATWVTITGTNLSATTNSWSDFTDGNLPTILDGVTVTINRQPAYVYFVSPNQINVLVPDDPTTGMVPVQVTNSQGSSNSFAVNKKTFDPALFSYSQFGGFYAAIQDALTYQLVAPPGTFGKMVTTLQAASGESLTLYATGLGPVTPAQPTGKVVQTSAPTANPVTLTIGGKLATVQFAGLIGAGLYQINVTVPLLPSGDATIALSVGGTASAGQTHIPIQILPSQAGGFAVPPLVGCLTGRVDYITYSRGLMTWGQADEASIGGTQLCATCLVKPPIYPEFAVKLDRAIYYGETVQVCYDQNGVVYQVKVTKR